MNARYIVVEGNIGAGKTSLATRLAEYYNSELVLEEFAENSFLPLFYQNPDRWAFPLELSFLADRYKQLKTVFENARSHSKLIVADYLMDKSGIFASKNLHGNEQVLYTNFFDIVKDKVPAPDLLIFLNCSIDKLLQNIAGRGREFEKNISREYLQGIDQQYRQFLNNSPGLNILEIETTHLNFKQDQDDFESIVNQMEDALKNNSRTLFTAL